MLPTHLLLVLLIPLVVGSKTPDKDRDMRQFGGNYNPSSAGESGSKAVLSFANKECSEQPTIENARVTCVSSGCRVRCNRGYRTSRGYVRVNVVCDKTTGRYTYDNIPWESSNLACNPYCGEDGCHNGGICVSPGMCQCASGFSGDKCQVEDTTPPQSVATQSIVGCPEPQLDLGQATASWTPTKFEVECNPGFVFPIGGRHLTVHCREGMWDMPPGLFSPGGALVCQAECSPPCQNGGTCIHQGLCDCPIGYWGPHCQLKGCTTPRGHGVANSCIGGNFSRFKIQCHEGYQMLSGKRWVTVFCRDGEWVIPRKGLMKDNDVKCYPEDK